MGDPTVPNQLTASSVGVTDADNVTSAGFVDAATVDWTWLVEVAPGSGIFEPIVRDAGLNGTGDPVTVGGETITLTAAEAGLRLRVRGRFQDEALVFETIRSNTVRVIADPNAPPVVVPPGPAALAITRARSQAPRLRVEGDVSPVGSTIIIFAPGTAISGSACGGTSLGNIAVAQDGSFAIDRANFGNDPGSVCVEASNGIAVDANTTN